MSLLSFILQTNFFFAVIYFLNGHFCGDLFLQTVELDYARTMCTYVYMDTFLVIYFREFLILTKVAKIIAGKNKLIYSSLA